MSLVNEFYTKSIAFRNEEQFKYKKRLNLKAVSK